MKNKLIALIVAAACLSASAQTIISSTNPPASFLPTNAPAGATSFISDVATWTTSFNTNNLWSAQNFQIDSGVATITGGNIADRIDLVKNFGAFEAGVQGELLGVGSAFDQVQGVFGYDLVEEYDFKLAVELGGGYDFSALNAKGAKVGAYIVEPGLAAYKMITSKTYAVVKYSFPIESIGKFNQTGVFYVGAGFTF